MSQSKIYPSKRVKNYAAKKLRRIFGLKGKIILKHAPSIYYPERCYGLCYSENDNDSTIHRIIMSEELNASMKDYLATLLHEYVHAWQFENGYKPEHTQKSKFKQWAKYLKETQKGVII
jgi:SprT-like family